MTAPETLYILDGSYYVFRAFYAIQSLSNSKGFPTNGLYAFTNMLLNVIRDQKPHHIAVAFDPPGDTFRHELYEPYKANRESPPDELRLQMPHFRRIVKALNIPVIEVPGFEADDVIGTMTKSPLRAAMNVVVLTGDKDMYQLVDAHTTLVDSMRGKVVGLDEVVERFQVGPEGVADVLALAGDTSDNVPGVPGIGEKTAGKLIADFGTLENLLNNIDKVSGAKRKENLLAFADQARLSQTLVTIKCDVPLEVTADALKAQAPDFDAFDALCAEFEFNKFPRLLREIYPEDSQARMEQRLESPSVERRYSTIWSLDELAAIVATIADKKRFAIDLETTSLDPLDAEIVGIALSHTPGEAFYIPVGHLDISAANQLALGDVLAVLRPVLEDPSIEAICQNGAYELRVFARAGIDFQAFAYDTMLAAWLLEPNRRRYGLDALANEYLQESTTLFTDVAGSGAKQVTFDQVPVDVATLYGAEDADITLRLADVLSPALEAQQLMGVLRTIEVPLARVLARMESTGIRVDSAFLGTLSEEFSARIDAQQAEIFALAGREFNVNSPKQLREILFDELNLPVIKRTKTGPSTDQDVLEELSKHHALPRMIVEFRHLSKLRSTYVDALPALVHARTGRVHTSYNQAVAATGRLSSSDPNLQNIPIRSEDGRRIRTAFVPQEGWTLLGGDYSQIELRILAHMSEDPVLIDAFVQGEDIHRRTAAEVFGVRPDEVSSDQRAAAKAINFGLIYGMGARRLAEELGVTNAQAQRYIEQYFERISGVKPFLEGLVEAARTTGYATTLAGRRRPIPELAADNKRFAAQGERLAMNTPIQGAAADLIKIAMVRIDARMREEGFRAHMLLQVHDELVFEAPDEELDALEALAREEMESVWALHVPLRVDFSRGKTWADM